MTFARWNNRTGEVLINNVGRVLVDFGDERRWIIKGAEGLELFERNPRGRPRQHDSKANKQRAYRERKKGKALRKYEKGV